MTIDEARELCQLQLESLMSNPQVTLDPEYIQAERMAIASLGAWERVKDDIREYETDCLVSADCADCKDCNVVMFKSIYQIINKHLQVIKNG